VSNQSPQTVVAWAANWQVRTKRGTRTTHHCWVRCPDAVCGDGSGRRSGQEREIAPGGLGLMARGCAVTPENIQYQEGAWLDRFVQENEQELADVTELSIDLDAVIFDDGALIGPDHSRWSVQFAAYVNAKQDVYRTIVQRLEHCKASEDFFGPIRAMLWGPEHHDKRDPLTTYPSQAAAEAIGWQRRALLDVFKPAIRAEPFVIRRRSTS
jgi:hypothetical protein